MDPNRWTEPSAPLARARFRALNGALRHISSPRRRAEIEASLDALCGASGVSGNHDAFPTAVNPNPTRSGPQDLQSLMDKFDAPEEGSSADPRIAAFLSRKRADAIAKVQVWADVADGIRTAETRKLAESAVSADCGTNYGWFSEQVRAALIEFQLDGWAGTEPSAHTLEYVRDVHPVFAEHSEPASQDRSVVPKAR